MEYPNLSLSSQSCSWLSWTHSAASAVLQLLPWVYLPSKRLTRPLISFLELMRSGREPGRAGPAPQGAAPSLFAGKAGAVPNSRLGSVPGCPGWPQGGTRGAHKAQVPAASPARDASTWIWDHPRCGNRQHHAGKTRHPREMRFSLNICPFLTLLSCLRLGQKELGD